MARTLLWNIKEQKEEGVYPNATDANVARDKLIAERSRVDGKQHGVQALTTSDFQNVSVN